ncbi:hypothetical protein BBK36DRAFT_1163127 [Trichoderma citrinoviride]|uniref:F-box domain-containing protein n=1 Tax=Trichoderma citrinoviride TaxID=58853 RepID=A0A2T4AZF1_9HYPO|nr:hypothetical protein BBK36DRAFT_1163127 [Trichoderma citrinoviride]PTB62445.1 hypothetical protein BBK36DRAFT_1163127 [Trichoderma citrinoviride]
MELNRRKGGSSLDRVPDEIIGHLLYYISPYDLANVQLVSHRFYRLANSALLWRHHCRSSFHFWHPRHRFHEKTAALAQETNWKDLFIYRNARNRQVAHLLNDIIRTKVNRVRGFEIIGQIGYDAKDFLLGQCQTPPSAEDGLARRYYSNALLDTIHKHIAIHEWHSLMQSAQPSSIRQASEQLERALGAFDLFVLHDQPGDLDDITRMFDAIGEDFRSYYPKSDDWSTRKRALKLLRWLRALDFTGMRNPEQNYRNLRNCLIGQALRHPDHESIPLISTAIFCCVAARVGIDARCCAFPTHVHAIVYPPDGHTLDDEVVGDSETAPERMFLDPYGSDDEIPLSHLRMTLARLGLQQHNDLFLAPVLAPTMAMRTAQNIRATVARISDLQEHAHPELSQLLHGNNRMNADACLYAASWATLLLMPPNNTTWLERLAKFLRRFPGAWPEDVWMVEKYLWPLYSSVINPRDGFPRNIDAGFGNPWQYWQFVRDADGMAPLVHRRDLCDDPRGPPFYIGQVFRHRRYGWLGAITSWHERGSHQSSLPGRARDEASHQRPTNSHYSLCFMCITETEPEQHVVALRNVELISDPSLIKEDMFPMAGKFFKRFDPDTCRFISNIREEYPLD